MNELQHAQQEGIISRFFNRFRGMGEGIDILQNPTEEIRESLERGKLPTLYGMAKRKAGKAKLVRKEENYLWSTRRFPNNSTNNTIGSGAIVSGDYDYF